MARRFDPDSPLSRYCESCFLNEAATARGAQLLCEDCAYEAAWSEFLAAIHQINTNRPYASRVRRTHKEMT
jgi:hypothetical protein